MAGGNVIETSVMIVGGGPVGLALAGDLGWRGVDCLLVEETDGAITTPKMNEVNIRTMEFCRRWGIADRVMGCPFPQDYPMDIAFVTTLGGRELARMKRPAKKDQRPNANSPMSLQICSQLWFDPILREFAASFPTVRLRHRCRHLGFAEMADGIQAEIEDRADGTRTTVRARYLVACDGATSAIRDGLGVGLEGPGVLGRPIHFFFRAPGMLQRLGVAPATFFLAFDRDGLWANIRVIDPANALWRLMVLDTPPELEASAIDRDAYIRRAVGHDYPVEWVGLSVWTRRGLVAERLNAGRVFIAGDAAHQLSPTGALGMNTGIGDAVDLGWKLAAAVDGWGGPGLPASYDAERRPVGMRNVARATEFHHDHLAFKGFADLEDESPAGRAARARLGEELVDKVGQMFRTDGLQIGYRYEDSPICVADGTPATPDEIETYQPSARPGSRAPHAALSDGRSTLDLYGRGFVLLRTARGRADPEPLARAADTRGVPLRVVAVEDPAVGELYGASLALVRPDGHVAWRADAPPADPLAVIDRVRGA